MPAADHGLKILARLAGRALPRLAGLYVTEWEPLESTLQTTVERLADRVFRAAQDRERFIVYQEFVTEWDPAAPWNLLAKAGLLSERERLPTVCIVFVLQRRGFRSQGGALRLTVGGNVTQELRYHEVRLWELTPEPWWEDVPALMALYPLCRHRESPRQAVAHAAAVIERGEVDRGNRAETLAILSVFGKMMYPTLDVLAVIGREKMIESKFFEEVQAIGALDRGREDTLAVLEERFGRAQAAEFAAAVNALDDSARLNQLLRLAVRCAGPEEFRQAVAELPARQRRKKTAK